MSLWVYDVTFRATRPERPNLKTQTFARVQASGADDAVVKARVSLERDGWRVGEFMSAVRRFRAK